MVDAVAGFVSERPENDRRMILERFHHSLHTVDTRPFPFRPHGRVLSLFVAESVGFQIGFAHHVKPVAVADFIEHLAVRIVAGAYGVDVVALHLKNVFHDRIIRYGTSEVGLELVAVDAAEHDRDAVDKEVAVFEFHRAEPDPETLVFNHSIAVFQSQEQSIEVGRFRAPFHDIPDFRFETHLCAFRLFDARLRRKRFLENGTSALVEQLGFHNEVPDIFLHPVSYFDFEFKDSVFVFFVQKRFRENIEQVHFRERHDGYVTEDAAQPPHVLILQIGSVGPLEHLNRDAVQADLRDIGDVEFRGIAAAFAHAGKLPVDPDIHERIDAVEFEHDTAVLP